MNLIEGLIQTNRESLLLSWKSDECRADTMFTTVKNITHLFIDSSYKRLESLAKILLQFLRAKRDPDALSRLLPNIRAYRQGIRDAKQLRVLLERELQGVLLADAVELGLSRGVFVDLGYAINLTPEQPFETLYPKP